MGALFRSKLCSNRSRNWASAEVGCVLRPFHDVRPLLKHLRGNVPARRNRFGTADRDCMRADLTRWVDLRVGSRDERITASGIKVLAQWEINSGHA